MNLFKKNINTKNPMALDKSKIKLTLILIIIGTVLFFVPGFMLWALMNVTTAERWLHEQLHKEEYISAKIFIIPFATWISFDEETPVKEESFAVCNYKYKEDKQLIDSVMAFSLRNPVPWDTLHKYFYSYHCYFYLVDTTHNNIHNLKQEYYNDDESFKLFYEIIWKIEKDSATIEISKGGKGEYLDRYTYHIPITKQNKQYILNPYQLGKKFLSSYCERK